jgi:predicted small integral membrane protein
MRQQKRRSSGLQIFDFVLQSSLNASSTLQTPFACVRLLKSYRADKAKFVAALDVAVIAPTMSLLMWFVAFLDVGANGL